MRTKLPEFRLVMEPMSEEARAVHGFKRARHDIGKRSKIGGSPTLLQIEDEWPKCSDCRQEMTFYGQLDSVGDKLSLADAGLICVFVCFDCLTTTSMLQST